MDPALRELLRDAEQDPDATVETIVRFRHRDAVVPGVRVVARFGTIATCRIRARDVVDVRSHPLVVSCKAARPLGPDYEARAAFELPDGAAERASEFRPTDVRRPPGLPLTGRGVVVGALDWGLDFAAACFRRPGGRTRLLGLFDQRDRAGAPPAMPYGYGSIHTSVDIDAALGTDHPYRALGYHPADTDPGNGSHGTHVLDIAAGNGRSGGPLGVACDADLMFVHLADRDTGGLANIGDSLRLLEAVDYVRRTAAGRPWVVNLSVGRHGGPHDGSTLVEMALDELLGSTPGCFVGQSAGNYFRADTHASGVVPDGGARTLRFGTHPADTTLNELEIWYAGADRFVVDLTPPGASAGVRVRLGASADIVVDGTVVGRLYHRAYDPNDGDHVIDGFLYPSAPAGTWTVTLHGERVVDGRYHAWLERDQACPECQARFRPSDAAPMTTTGTLANGHLPLVVGAYDGHLANRPLARSSSSGPTRDERPKPDLVACGVDVLAARSAPAGSVESPDLLIRKSGTSMATPHVTGAAALCLQSGGTSLDARRIRSLILTTTRPAGSSYDPHRVGHGFLDLRALSAALGPGTFDLSTAKELAMTISPNGTESPKAAAVAPDSSVDPLAVLAATPARAYREFLYRPDGPFGRWMAQRFTVLARPGERLAAPSFAGDVLLSAVLGAPRGGDCHTLNAALDLGRMRVLPAGHLLLRPRMADVYVADSDELAEDSPDHIAVSHRVWRGLGLPPDVNIRDIKELPNELLRTFVFANQIAAWTNSPHDVYVTPALADEDFARAVLYHEAIHIRQFRADDPDRPPPSYAHMMRYECDAYRESAKWAREHARVGVQAYAPDLEKSARKFCGEITAAVAARLGWPKLNARYKRFLVNNRFLPEHDFPLTDLYGAVRSQPAEDQSAESGDLELLLRDGRSENDITDALFFARHPEVSRTAIRRGSAHARQWTQIGDTEVRPAVRRALVIQPANPVDLATFLSQYEGDARVPAAVARRFLTDPVLLSLGRSLRDRVLAHWRNGGRPLTPLRFYQLAFELAGHAATATLLCHNVAKAFVRGGTAISWSGTTPEGTYTDGQHTYTAAVIHPAGQLRYLDRSSGREKTSIFYLLFSAKEFGTADPGDWYHFFVTATICAHGNVGALAPGTRRSREEDSAEDRGGRVDTVVYQSLLGDRIADLERKMTAPTLRGVPGYRGWVLANVLSFLEGGYYGKDYALDQSDVERESRIHLRGAVFGLQTIGGTPGPAWRWHVPKAGTISRTDLALGIDLRASTAQIWRADGTTASEELETVDLQEEADRVLAMDAESPAFIAVAGTLISAAQLGIAVFDRLESHLLRGAFSVDAAPATYIHDPSPLGLTVQTRVFTFPLTAFHPRYGFGTETFWFTVTLEYDGFNIRRASIVEDRARSSTLVSSDFSITFTPSRYTATNEPVTAIAYNIKGRWDPIGRGDESFDGAFRLDAAGNLHGLQVTSPRSWVRSGNVTQTGGGPVPRPTRASHQTDVHFDRAGSARLSQASIRHIYDWFQALPSPVQTEIRVGSLPVRLTGRASTTGTIERNQRLARQRAEAVAAVLRDLAGSRTAITLSAHGELGARTPDALEDPAERRVEITCEYQVYRI